VLSPAEIQPPPKRITHMSQIAFYNELPIKKRKIYGKSAAIDPDSPGKQESMLAN
jgi:hypothetical protein